MTAAIALAVFGVIFCIAMWKNWELTAIVFGLATLSHGCSMLGG